VSRSAAGDPATPYPCIVDPVDAYLLDGKVPAAGIRCPANQPSAALKAKLPDHLRPRPRRFRSSAWK
jgi:hypothetical protein